MTNSKSKGKRGELELAEFLRECGYEARRGQQFAGGQDSPDIIHNVSGIHFEAKRCEQSSPSLIYSWIKQAQTDAPPDRQPVIAFRSNRQCWLAIMTLDEFLYMVEMLDSANKLIDEVRAECAKASAMVETMVQLP